MRILLATRNAGKLAELRPLLAPLGHEVVTLADAGIAESPAEDDLERFETFEENALAKARWFHALAGGAPVIADDSGLVVDALGGQPGVRSKRWSGRSDLAGSALDAANNARLLQALEEVGAAGVAERAARYVCVAAYVAPGLELVRRGECEGRILAAPRGSGGFGYDPLFESAELGRTFGELSRDEKARVSHRGRALRSLAAELARAH